MASVTLAKNSAARAAAFPVDDPREVSGWIIYDWANSAFVTTVSTVLLGPYLTALAQAATGENGTVASIGDYAITAKSFFPFCVAASVFLQVFLVPVLGVVADYTNMKKSLMMAFCFTGAAATCLLFFITGDLYLLGGLLYIVANFCFGNAVVLYNAYLNDITSEAQRDTISSRGYAWGYLGGGILLGANLALVTFAGQLGISRGMAVQLSLLSAGVWWGGFSIITFRRLRTRPAPFQQGGSGASWLSSRGVEARETVRLLWSLPHTLRYLGGYLLYNDGIQTVISMASVFLAQELFVANGLDPDESFLITLILMVQFVAFFGALGFERIAQITGAKGAILIALALWSAVVIYAYAFLHTTAQAWGMGVAIALVLGGSQALSRSLFSKMIPAGREATFYGVYEVAERGTSWIGPLIFGVVVGATGSYRDAILSLIVLLLAGMGGLVLTDVRRAMQDATAMTEAAAAAEAAKPATQS